MDLDSGNLTAPLKEARRLEDDGEYDQAKSMFLDYYDACLNQSRFSFKSIMPNAISALRGATRCFMKTNSVIEAEELLQKNLKRFKEDPEDISSAKMCSEIESLLSNVLELKGIVDRFNVLLDDIKYGPSSDRKGSGVQGRDNLAFHLQQTIREIILFFYYRKVSGEDAVKSLVDTVVEEIKSGVGEEITWEPQVLSYLTEDYGSLGFQREAIELGLYALELTKRYSEDTPQTYRLREDVMRRNFIDWYLIVGEYDECEKWFPKTINRSSIFASIFAGHQYLKMKKYEKAKACYEESIADVSHKWAFTHELIDLCDRRLGNDSNKELLRHALEIYEQSEPDGFMDEHISNLNILRVKDSLEGVVEGRYSSLIDELNRESLTENTTLSLIPITFHLYLVGVCYLRIGDREKAFRLFDRVVKIERDDRFTFSWTAEPEYSDFYDGVVGDMRLRELYDEKFHVVRYPKDVLKFEFTDEEFETFTRMTKKEHLEEGAQSELDEVSAIVRSQI